LSRLSMDSYKYTAAAAASLQPSKSEFCLLLPTARRGIIR